MSSYKLNFIKSGYNLDYVYNQLMEQGYPPDAIFLHDRDWYVTFYNSSQTFPFPAEKINNTIRVKGIPKTASFNDVVNVFGKYGSLFEVRKDGLDYIISYDDPFSSKYVIDLSKNDDSYDIQYEIQEPKIGRGVVTIPDNNYTQSDIQNMAGRYGRITNIIKSTNGYWYVTFFDERDARDFEDDFKNNINNINYKIISIPDNNYTLNDIQNLTWYYGPITNVEFKDGIVDITFKDEYDANDFMKDFDPNAVRNKRKNIFESEQPNKR